MKPVDKPLARAPPNLTVPISTLADAAIALTAREPKHPPTSGSPPTAALATSICDDIRSEVLAALATVSGRAGSRRSSAASVTSLVSLSPAQRRAFLKKIRLRRNVQVPGVMYTDQARAAAVALGECDIKHSLRNRRYFTAGRGFWIPEDSSFSTVASHAKLALKRGDPTYAIQLWDRVSALLLAVIVETLPPHTMKISTCGR